MVAAALWLAVMNGILGVFNLLPGAPLDGGRVLRAVLWRRFGDRERAERAAGRTGQVLGAVIVATGIAEAFGYRSAGGSLDGLWLVLVGWFLISAATAETRASQARSALTGLRVADVMTPHPELVSGRDSVSQFVSGAARSQQDAFPVIGPAGELTGIVLTSQVDDVPAQEWVSRRLDQIAPCRPARLPGRARRSPPSAQVRDLGP